MRQFIVLLLFCLLVACNRQGPLDALKTGIDTRLSKEQGVFAVAFRDLQTGDQLLINAHETFHAASTMKTPVMIEVYKQAAAGKWSLADSVEIINEFTSIVDGSPFSLDIGDDSEEVLYSRIGRKSTLADLTYDMIIVSSNLATNIIIQLVDAKNVTQTMRELGARDILVLRGVEDSKAYGLGLNNTTTAYDLMLIFEHLALGRCVSKDASDDMIRILKDQKFGEIIPAQLPEGVSVAHKTGSITGVRHDSGIVFLPDGRKYVLVLLSREMPDPDAGVAALADVSRMICDYVASSRPSP
jgi:beta-lactamase class A